MSPEEAAACEGEQYVCSLCGFAYTAGTRTIRCAVWHGDGSCCHYTDKRLEAEPLV